MTGSLKIGGDITSDTALNGLVIDLSKDTSAANSNQIITGADIGVDVIAIKDIHAAIKGVNVNVSASLTDVGSHTNSLYGMDLNVTPYSASNETVYGVKINVDDNTTTATDYGLHVTAATNYFSGNVGIGTTSPSDNLHIQDSVPGLRIVDTGNDATAQIGYSDGSGFFLRLPDDANNEDVMIRSYGDTVFNGGNVGIGTTSPGYLTELRVNDTVVDTPRLVIRQLGTGDSSLAFQMPDSPFGWVMGADNSDSDRFKISTGVGDVDSSPRFEIDPGGTTIHRYTGAENTVQIHSGVGSSTTGTSQIYFSSKDEHGGNTHQSYIKSTIDGTSSTSATKMTFHNRDSGGTVQEYMAIRADGLVQLNQNNVGSAGDANKFLSVGGELSTQFDETNVGTMTGMIISNEYTNASNQSGTACGIVFTHHSASSGISYIASEAGANGGDRSDLVFGTRGSGGVEERFRLRDSGEIFIGKGGDGYVYLFEVNDNSNYFLMYTHTDTTFRLNHNGSGSDELQLQSDFSELEDDFIAKKAIERGYYD